jgi:hypothetical protein
MGTDDKFFSNILQICDIGLFFHLFANCICLRISVLQYRGYANGKCVQILLY